MCVNVCVCMIALACVSGKVGMSVQVRAWVRDLPFRLKVAMLKHSLSVSTVQ